MRSFRAALSWILCALLLGSGLPLRERTACAPDQGARSCCTATDSCCCRPEVVRKCPCGLPQPKPLPAPPVHKEPLPQPADEPPTIESAPWPPAAVVVAHRAPVRRAGPLPHRSLQEALSVWRC